MNKNKNLPGRRILIYGMSDNPGGIETYLLNLVKNTENEDVVWDFVTDFPQVAYREILEEKGGKIFQIPAKSKGLLKQWRKFAAILKAHPEYQTVYFNVLNAGCVFTMLIPWLYRRKIVVHSHNASADNTTMHKLCRPFMNAMTSRYVACSGLAGEFMFGEKVMRKKQVFLMPNAIDAEKYEYKEDVRGEMRRTLGVEGKLVLCHVGRIVYQKNPKGVIDILGECVKHNPNCVLLSVGTGDMEAETKAYAEEKGLSAQVQFLGVRGDVDKIMQAADCFVLPSVYEGLPIVAVEAQAAGLPCLLSDAISTETKLTEDTCFLPVDRPGIWAEKILSVKPENRKKKRPEIMKAGYDMEYQKENIRQLMQILM